MKRDDLLATAETQCKTKCNCGHTVVMLPTTEHTICTYCGYKVRNKSLSRFRYLLNKKRMEKENEQ